MKKSKILAISLGAVALTGFAVATPVLISSCSSDFVDYTLADDFLTLKPGAKDLGYKLERQKGTNNYDFYVPNPQWEDADFEQIITKTSPDQSDPTLSMVDKATLEKLGFDKNALNDPHLSNEQSGIQIASSPGLRDKNGNVVYPYFGFVDYKNIAVPNRNESAVVMDTFKIFQVNYNTFKKEIEKQGLAGVDMKDPTPEQITKYNKAFSNSTEKNYNFNFRFNIHPNKK